MLFSDGIGAFFIGLSQIFSFFSFSCCELTGETGQTTDVP